MIAFNRLSIATVLSVALFATGAEAKKKPEKSLFDDCPVSETIRVPADASIDGLESLANCDDVDVRPADPEDMRVLQTSRIRPRQIEAGMDNEAWTADLDAKPIQGTQEAMLNAVGGRDRKGKMKRKPGVMSYGQSEYGMNYVRIRPTVDEFHEAPVVYAQPMNAVPGPSLWAQSQGSNAGSKLKSLTGDAILSWRPKRYKTAHDELIEEVARRHRVDPLLLHAVIKQESGYRSVARSHVGARGLMQIMPGTGAMLGVATADLNTPAINVDAGARLLRQLAIKYNGNFDLVLAAYNAGEGAVKKYGYRIPPYRETQDYVRKVMGNYNQFLGDNLAGGAAE
jgi:Transglycosylase SLT domain